MITNPPDGERGPAIAVLPVVNISGTPAPLKTISRSLINALNQKELKIIAPDVVESVVQKYRIRYLGGINYITSRAFRQEAGAEAVLVTNLELYSDVTPPKIALTSRLISTTKDMQVLWMSGTGLAGDDAPGLLDLNLIEDPQVLLEMAVQNLASSLFSRLSGQPDGVDAPRIQRKFQPKVSFRAPVFDPGVTYRVAVIPFFNVSERKHAGEMIALQFVKALHNVDNFFVIEPGVVRQALLNMRVIMGEGISLADADLLFSRLKADLVLSGNVMDYQDYQGLEGNPGVDFSTQIIEKRSREVVWTAQSHNRGDDRVFFFDWGRVNTAYAMSTQMVHLAIEDLFQ